MKKNLSFVMAVGWVFSLSLAGPITTVPWNGHPGAASFTFDDGLHSQTNNLTFLNSMKDVTVTFFVCTRSMDFGTNSQPHLEYASKGHEIGNHTANHKNLTETTDYNTEISGAASTLRGMKRADGTNLQVTSLATPYCAQNQGAKNAINQEHFINRGCGGSGLTGWDNEPDWMQIDSHYWQSGNSVQTFQGSFDQAATGKWHVQLNHGVGGDWDAISAADIKTLIEYAVSKNLWVASFSTVGAYLRAHFTIDKATSTTTSTGFKVTWTSPHAHMPKSVPLRVKIEGASGKTVMQKGVAIPANSDGTYTIEFMDLELEVTSAAVPPTSSSAIGPTSSNSNTGVSAEYKIEMEDYMKGGEDVAYGGVSGDNGNTGYRDDDAGVVTAETGYAIGYTQANEWLKYSVDITCAGQYKVVARAGTGSSKANQFTVTDGSENTVTFKISNPGSSWDNWDYEEIEGSGTVSFSQGTQTFTLTFVDNYTNVDWIKFTSDNAQCPDAIPVAKDVRWNSFTGPVQYQVFDMNGHLLKSATVSAQGGVQGLWQGVSAGLPKGMYVLRYGKGGSMRSVQVRK